MPSRIADLVEVTAAETVVRLDGAAGRLDELVLTGDVTRSLAAVLEATRGPRGAGFLLVGHFGSGKSHFLAALGELLAEPSRARQLRTWDGQTREMALAARPSLAVAVPLVEYRAEANLEEVTWRRAWQALDAEPRQLGSDRAAGWAGLLAAVRESGRAGLLVLIDELSEFLRAKRGPALTEDLRFLQFLGEWARQGPVVVVAALQESLEEVASVSERELARIRDRFPVRLGLSMRHVEDLVRGRLVPLRPGAEEELERVQWRLRATQPGWQVTPERFRACYPLHPDTLTLLDGLRFLLSQQRGAVDFICRQLRGDPAAGIPAWQDRPAADLLCPDRVYDHFEARLRERVETARLAETVVPYYERAAPALLEDEADQALALRAVKLLTLLAASPLERRRDAAELAGMLLVRMSSVDASANAAYLERAVLEPLARHGAYVVGHPEGAAATYEVELEADAGLTVARLVEQERARLQPDDRRVVETLLDLGGLPALSVSLLRQSGRSRRQVIWQNTLRHVLVNAARLSELRGAELEELIAATERTRCEACVVVAEPEPAADLLGLAGELAAASRRLALWVPAALDPAELEFAADLFCRQVVLRQAMGEGRGRLLDFLRRSVDSDVARAREVVRRCYFQGRLVAADVGPGPDLPALSGLAFEGVLRGLAGPLLHQLHPRHREVQPHAELVSDRHVRRLISVALAEPRITVAAAEREGVRAHVDAFLVPLGVTRKRGDAYLVAPDPARSPAVAELLRLVAAGPRDRADLTAELAAGPVGLSEPEALLLLNAAVLSGIVEGTRGRRRVEAPFLSLEEVERVGPGELLAPELLRRLPELAGVVGPGPYQPWEARVQQASWEHARAWLEARRDEAAQLREGMGQLAASPLHSDAQLGGLTTDLDRVERLLAAVDVQSPPRRGLESLLAAVDEPAELLRAGGRVEAAARFCRGELGTLMGSVAYLFDPALRIPDGAVYERLREARAEALGLAAQALPLAVEDRGSDALDAVERARRAFAATYETEHERYNAAVGPAAAAPVTSSVEYRALALLSEVAAVGVPDDRARVDRALAAATAAPCTRRVEAELALRPVCGCGFTLGTEPPRLDAPRLVATAARGVAEHLAELGRAEPRARLERAAEDLVSLGQAELGADLSRLLQLAATPERADAAAVVHLVGGPLFRVLGQVLRGGQVVVRRDLSALRAELAGRRYPRRRLLELLQAWVDGQEAIEERAVVEVVDGDDTAVPEAAATAAGATAAFLGARYPVLSAALPAQRPADAFWLAAWWAGRPQPPAWLPPALLAAPGLGEAAVAAAGSPGPRADLAELDGRLGPGTVAGSQVAAALDLGARPDARVVEALLDERLLRAPVRLAGEELARRLAADPRLGERLPAGGLERLVAEHPLLTPADVAPLRALLAAASCLAELQRRLPEAGPAELVADVYPAHHAPVAGLIGEAAAGWTAAGLAPEALEAFVQSVGRGLAETEAAFQAAARSDWPGCLRLWEVGEVVVAPLLAEHGRVAVLLVDAMRADLWLRLRDRFRQALPGRTLVERWAVVPEPTRTAEAVASLSLGRRVGGGEVDGPGDLPAPFAQLGAPSALLIGADADGRGAEVRDRWRSGPALTVVAATRVDELLHRTPVDLPVLLGEAAAGLERRILPTLEALPDRVPLVVVADHGFRENRWWGRGSEARYAHGGLSLEESVVPVATLVAR